MHTTTPESARPFWFGFTLGIALTLSPRLLVAGDIPSSFAPDKNRMLDQRWLWEHRQRAFPLAEIPEGAYEQALIQTRSADRDRALKDGSPIPDRWLNIGPAPQQGGQVGRVLTARPMSGRVQVIAVDPADANHWLIGAARGGVWATHDSGHSWLPLTDDQASLAMGAIAFAPSNPNVIYAGTGEGDDHGYAGAGVLRSADGGATWALVGATMVGKTSCSEIKVDPANVNVLLVATTFGTAGRGGESPPSGPTPGIFKSTDGGQNWGRHFTGSVSSLAVQPANFNNQYAGAGNIFGNPANGLYRSASAGDSWQRVSGPWDTLPGGVGRMELALAPSNPNILYVSVQDAVNQAGADGGLLGLWRTSNAWDPTPSWVQIPMGQTDDGTGTHGCCGWDPAFGNQSHQCWYNQVILVDPANANVLYFGGIALWRYNGANWSEVSKTVNDPANGIHVDQHALAWAGSRLIASNDGGVWSSTDGGNTWLPHNAGLSISTFYYGSIHPTNPNFAVGGLQDNGTAAYTGSSAWNTIGFGDGADNAISTARPGTDWAISSQNLNIKRTIDGGLNFVPATQGIDPKGAPFISRLEMCPVKPNLFIAGTTKLWRSDNFFSATTPTWVANSTDMGAELTALAFAPSDSTGSTYAFGTGDGQLRRTVNGGGAWSDLDPGNAVPNRYVTALTFDPANANVLYVTLSGFDEGTPGKPGHVFKTSSAMSTSPTWVNVSPPANLPYNSIVVDPVDPNIVYVGTDIGIWKSTNAGGSWSHMGPEVGMPNVAVYDLQASRATAAVVAFTHGRGAFALQAGTARNPPTIATFAPTNGAVGTRVTITGTKYTGTTSVTFNSVAASFTVDSATQITATVPAGAITGRIRVTNADGSADSAANFIVANAPVITSFAPSSGGPGTAVMIQGVNFTGASNVKFNGLNATFTVNSDTLITATVPSGSTTGTLSVTTPNGTANAQLHFEGTTAPAITGFTPGRAGVGSSVVIAGVNFSGATSVQFNQQPATFTLNSAIQITATVPAGVTTGPLRVTTPNGSATSSSNFTLVLAPTITGFAPTSAAIGSAVSISGANFSDTTNVTFNGLSAYQFRVDSPANLTAVVPAAATTGPIRVLTLGGTATSSAALAIMAPPANDLFANAQLLSGPAGSVSGSNLAATKEDHEPDHADNPGGRSVWYRWTAPGNGLWVFDTSGSTFDTTLAVYTGNAVETLTLVAQNDDAGGGTNSSLILTATAGTVYRIAVDGFNSAEGDLDNPATLALVSAGAVVLRWSLPAAAPVILSFNPASGQPGTEVTIRGTNFTGATAVAFNGVNAASFVVKSALEISAVVPSGAGSGPIRVTTPNGTAASAGTFSFVTPPNNDRFADSQTLSGDSGKVNGSNLGASREPGEPNHVGVTNGRSVWFAWTAPGSGAWRFDTAGSSFDTVLAVYLGNSLVTLSVVATNDDTTADQSSAVSFAATTGTVYRLAVDGFDAASGSFTLNWSRLSNLPGITSFAPSIGNVGTTVTITGTNFTGASAVTFGGVNASSFAVQSATQITATVPLGASTGTIGVRAPNGSATSQNNFVVQTAGVGGNDLFANARLLTGNAAVTTGDNRAATKELSEPNHAGVPGGKSIWYRWTAPASGTWTVDTEGSSFDTVLGIYLGTNVNNLTGVAFDDDGGAGVNSKAGFSAVAGQEYHFAVDGYDAESGDVVIRLRPLVAAQSIYSTGFEFLEGYSTLFQWQGQNGWLRLGDGGNGIVNDYFPGLGQQAYIGFDPLSVASNDQLFIWHPLDYSPNTNARPVVRFSVDFMIVDSSNFQYDDFRWAVYNRDVHELLQLAFDNLHLGIYYRINNGAGFQNTGLSFQNATRYQLTLVLDFGRNRWSGFLDDTLLVNNAVLSADGSALNLGDIDALWNLGQHNTPGDNYMLIDNYRVVAEPGIVPAILLAPQSQAASVGANAVLSVVASGGEPLQYQWRFNGADIPGATGPLLFLNNIVTNQAGSYSVVVSNAFGAITSAPATLSVSPQVPSRLIAGSLLAGGRFQITLVGNTGSTYVIETSDNLRDWHGLATVVTTNANTLYTDTTANDARRYYRARLSSTQ